MKPCLDCGEDFSRHGNAKRCATCALQAEKRYHSPNAKQLACYQIVKYAIKGGILPKLDGSVPCKDCGDSATDYDHRDYMKPMDVAPVCKKCNRLRGPAINHKPGGAYMRITEERDRQATVVLGG